MYHRNFSLSPDLRRSNKSIIYCKNARCLCKFKPSSSSQPTLNSSTLFAARPRKSTMIATSIAASTSRSTHREPVRNEKFDENDICLDSDGSVLSGSVEALIKRLIPTRDRKPDTNYIFTLILNIRTVMSPEELMQKIVQHVMFSQNSASENFNKEGRKRMGDYILQLCGEWATQIPYDFREAKMRERLSELFSLCSVDKFGRQRAEEIQKHVKNTLTKLDRYEKALKSLSQKEADESTSTSDTLTGLIKVNNNVEIIAHQLTHIELERFAMIGVDEVVDALAKSDISNLGKERNSTDCGNISHYVSWFNRLSSFVAGDILQHARKRHRVQVIEFWIDVAKECINLGNFNSLMAIVAGLSLPPISRLKRTWSKVDKAKLEILQHQLDPSGNFLSYRATMKAALWRADGAPDQIIIPFFVLLLKDLYLIYHGSSRVLPNGHLNYMSFGQLSDHLLNVLHWKSRTCTFPRNSAVLQHLLITQIHSENALMLQSFESEVPESNMEKEHYKKLKLNRV